MPQPGRGAGRVGQHRRLLRLPEGLDHSLILRNSGQFGGKDNHWLRLRFAGVTDAELAGARVDVYEPGEAGIPKGKLVGSRVVFSSHHHKAGTPMEVHFGLAKRPSVDVNVTLPIGKSQIFSEIAANKVHSLTLGPHDPMIRNRVSLRSRFALRPCDFDPRRRPRRCRLPAPRQKRRRQDHARGSARRGQLPRRRCGQGRRGDAGGVCPLPGRGEPQTPIGQASGPAPEPAAVTPAPVDGKPVLKSLPDSDAVRDAAGTGQLFECVHVPGLTDVRKGVNGFAIADLNRDGRPDL